jgi:CHAT domain-containing protein
VWIFDDRGVHQAAIAAPKADIDRAIRRFLRLCSDPHSDVAEIRRVGRQLYDWLIAPVEAQLAPSRLLAVETDGEIGRIPFNVLVTPSGDYFGERFEIVTSPGLEFWLRLRKAKPFRPSDRALVVGVTEGQGNAWATLPALPDAEKEAREVARLFPQSVILLDQAVTLDKVKRELLSVRVFHFAGHAVATADRNGLVFGASGSKETTGANRDLVNAAVIEKFQMPKLDLVVLSACATGADEGGLADPQSLVRVFLRAGAAEVVASRWGVDSASTAQLMQFFYKALIEGSKPPLALKRAEEAVRKQPSTSHPYYWASFSAFGRS